VGEGEGELGQRDSKANLLAIVMRKDSSLSGPRIMSKRGPFERVAISERQWPADEPTTPRSPSPSPSPAPCSSSSSPSSVGPPSSGPFHGRKKTRGPIITATSPRWDISRWPFTPPQPPPRAESRDSVCARFCVRMDARVRGRGSVRWAARGPRRALLPTRPRARRVPLIAISRPGRDEYRYLSERPPHGPCTPQPTHPNTKAHTKAHTKARTPRRPDTPTRAVHASPGTARENARGTGCGAFVMSGPAPRSSTCRDRRSGPVGPQLWLWPAARIPGMIIRRRLAGALRLRESRSAIRREP
jgi:hypothetical protein